MRSFSVEKAKKKKPVKAAFSLCVALSLALLLTACSEAMSPALQTEPPVPAAGETVTIEIKTPSAGELTIAPGRHFKISGSLSGEILDDASLRVMLLDAADHELRYAATNQKGTARVIQSIIGGEITVFTQNTDFSDVAYTAPEMAVADLNDPEASAHDATVKCVYTDTDFYALIVSATDPEHGLVEADGYELVDHEGKPYNALPEGRYTVRALLSSADGTVLAQASEDIEIGRTAGTSIHEMTTLTAIKKGGLDLVKAWVAEDNLTMLGDLLPGFFGTEYQMSTMPMSVSCETAEYLPGRIAMLIYGNMASSTSYALELAKYLQLEHHVEDPTIAAYYAFDLGEPAFAGVQAKIAAFGENESIRICRIDQVVDNTTDGVFLTTEEQVLHSDTDPSDGWTVKHGTFAVAGVMKPYQLRDDELVPDGEIFGFYRFLNGADSLIYTFTPADGSEPFSIPKAVGVKRIDEPGEETEPALLEFYNVFSADTLQAGSSYGVSVQAFDRYGAKIQGICCEFMLYA